MWVRFSKDLLKRCKRKMWYEYIAVWQRDMSTLGWGHLLWFVLIKSYRVAQTSGAWAERVQLFQTICLTSVVVWAEAMANLGYDFVVLMSQGLGLKEKLNDFMCWRWSSLVHVLIFCFPSLPNKLWRILGHLWRQSKKKTFRSPIFSRFLVG